MNDTSTNSAATPAESAAAPENTDKKAKAYRVLARKYRPTRFADLIGQDALTRTLANAFARGRIAHAFLLTGVRGVGKTTTARIIARALNCVGADGGRAQPEIEPCGVCEHCLAIAEDRHVDVLELDAASRTGVDDMRELIEGMRYQPVRARAKVYIIDEVHMLSNSAFNALLKTLEEPPPRVTFIFATTEPRKIPVTVVSRCQRFDLRRVETDALIAHFAAIAKKEGAEASADALALIARAADGSVRDGLSLLDQAISQSGEGAITETAVRDMLGLADRGQMFDLFDAVMRGDIAEALGLVAGQHAAGADAAQIVQDQLEIAHWLTRLKVTPDKAEDPGLGEDERKRGHALAGTLGMASLARCWQMLLKGLDDVRVAPRPMQALEMVLVRLAYAADLPSPADLVRRLTDQKGGPPAVTPPQPARATPSPTSMAKAPMAGAPTAGAPTAGAGMAATAALRNTPPEETQATAGAATMPQTFTDMLALLTERREVLLVSHLSRDVHLVDFRPGRIELRPTESAPRDLANRLGTVLNGATGARWVVSISSETGAPTVAEQEHAAFEAVKAEAAQDPLVRQVLDAFPGAEITDVRPRGAETPSPNTEIDQGEPTA